MNREQEDRNKILAIQVGTVVSLIAIAHARKHVVKYKILRDEKKYGHRRELRAAKRVLHETLFNPMNKELATELAFWEIIITNK